MDVQHRPCHQRMHPVQVAQRPNSAVLAAPRVHTLQHGRRWNCNASTCHYRGEAQPAVSAKCLTRFAPGCRRRVT